MPSPTGIAMSMAIAEVISVPEIGASAPNFSVTGFQRWVKRKPRPNSRIAGNEPITSDRITPHKMRRTVAAEICVRMRKPVSRSFSRRRTLLRSWSPVPDGALSAITMASVIGRSPRAWSVRLPISSMREFMMSATSEAMCASGRNKFPPLAKHIAYINGLPVASLMSLAHSLLISATTFSGIAI
jgi:hypothetical protein